MWRTSCCPLILLIALCVGCGSEPERLAVSGSILLDGKAIGNCILVLQSVEAEGSVAGATSVVSDGRFAISKSNGLVAGEYGVIFTEIQPDLEEYELVRSGGSKRALNNKFIPPKYTQPNELRVRVAAHMQPVSLELKSRAR